MSERKTVLKVEGWGCEGCTAATEDALKKLGGVKAVHTNLDKGTVEIAYDEAQVGQPQFEKAIGEAGYKVVK